MANEEHFLIMLEHGEFKIGREGNNIITNMRVIDLDMWSKLIPPLNKKVVENIKNVPYTGNQSSAGDKPPCP